MFLLNLIYLISITKNDEKRKRFYTPPKAKFFESRFKILLFFIEKCETSSQKLQKLLVEILDLCYNIYNEELKGVFYGRQTQKSL